MTRRRYVQINGELVEVPLDHVSAPRNHDALLWNDRSYQDVNDPRFHSRTSHREYMKRTGLTTVDDFKSTFARAAEERAARARGEDASRRADIARALEQRRG